MFYYNGKNFALRGIGEQYRLKVSQLVREYNPDRYVYTENGSKNRSGGIGDFNVPNKIVPVYSNPAARVRCHVFLLDMYIRKLPVKPKRDLDIFYMKPLSFVPCNDISPWYHCKQRIGRNTIATMVKRFSQQAGLENGKTNHSLRATGATRLFDTGVPQRIIQEHTGHKSVISLRSYEQISHQQNQAVSNIVTSGTHASGSFQDEVAVVKAVEAVNIKADLLLEDDLDAAFEKDLVVFDSIPMDLLFQ